VTQPAIASPGDASSGDRHDATSAVPALRLLMIEQGGQGGVADYTAELTRALGGLGVSVLLATAADNTYRPAPGVSVCGVFHYVRGHSRSAQIVRRLRLGAPINGVRFLLAIPRLLRFARRADVVHSQGWEFAPLGLIAILCLRLAGATVVQTSHNTFERGRALDRTHRALARLCACTIVHTQADRARVPRSAGGRVAVIAHGEYGGLARTGGQADRASARAALGIPADAPVTLMFGQLRADKGLDDLLAAVTHVPALWLIVAGKDYGVLAPARARLQSRELAARVIVREGFLEMALAAQLFAAADTVALPYKIASQSGVLLLAYGFQRPVVVYPVGGLVEAVVEGETGWVCARADVDALTDALAASVAAGWPECRRRGEAGRRFADERFAWPAIARRTTEVYTQALHGAAAREIA
jgi:glycosyltransferase involved in cell wall biosynthesis